MKTETEYENIGKNFAAGGEAELEAVMKLYGHALLKYCHNIICDYHEAQDAVQITFIKAYKKRSSFNTDMNLYTWLHKIAYNTCIDILRRKKAKPALEDMPARNNGGGHIPGHIRSALMTLKEIDRALIYSRAIEEKTFEELAKIHGKNAASLRKRYERAKKKLVGILAEDYPEYKNKTKMNWGNKNETKSCKE